MTIATRPAAFHAHPATVPARPGLVRRILDSMLLSRELHAQQEVDRYMSRQLGRFSDTMEREIGERMLGGNWNFRR